MDKKRAKIKLKEYLRKLDENTKDLPMSKEGSPTVTDTETGEVTYGRPRKYSFIRWRIRIKKFYSRKI
jgi:hypothetical protein